MRHRSSGLRPCHLSVCGEALTVLPSLSSLLCSTSSLGCTPMGNRSACPLWCWVVATVGQYADRVDNVSLPTVRKRGGLVWSLPAAPSARGDQARKTEALHWPDGVIVQRERGQDLADEHAELEAVAGEP